MSLSIPEVTTKYFPSTGKILSERLPRVLSSRCFNDQDLPFFLEVKDTEIGHLFEHILLEYLCVFKLTSGFSQAHFKGETWWDWRMTRRGTFYIRIGCGYRDRKIFRQALDQGIALLDEVLGDRPSGMIPDFRASSALSVSSDININRFVP